MDHIAGIAGGGPGKYYVYYYTMIFNKFHIGLLCQMSHQSNFRVFLLSFSLFLSLSL